MTEFFNRSSEKAMRRELRAEMPKAEVCLWSLLRRKQVLGVKFRRQYSVGPYCLDFYCPERRLAIEIDGDSHYLPEEKRRDVLRKDYIESFGIHFIRFTNEDVYKNLEGVIEAIAAAIRANPPASMLLNGAE